MTSKPTTWPGLLIFTCLAAAVCGAVQAASPAKHPISVDDLITVRVPSQARLSPDGRWVAYILTTPSLKDNDYSRDLYVVASNGRSAPRRIAQGDFQLPSWAPSSDRLAYFAQTSKGAELRAIGIDGAKPQILVAQGAIGEGFDLRPGDGSIGLSPDGRWLAFIATRKPPNPDASQITHGIEADEDWSPDRATTPAGRLFVMQLAETRARALTDDTINVTAFDWSPDGKRLALQADSAPESVASYMTADIYVAELEGGPVRALVKMPGIDAGPKWSPDGKSIAFVSQHGEEDWTYCTTLAVVQADGTAAPRYIGTALDRRSGGWSTPLRWSADGRFIDVAASHDLSRHLFRVRVSDGTVRQMTPRADRQYEDFSYSQDGKLVAFTVQGAALPPDVYVSDARVIKPIRLSDSNPGWRELTVPSVKTISWRSSDGKWDLKGLVLEPSFYQPGKRYPLLTDIQGGPAMVEQNLNVSFNYPLLVLAERGYVVFMPNTRGRQGFGVDFLHAIRDEHSYVLNPIGDVLSGVDALVGRGIADGNRTGLLGFSYGGVLTAYLVTATNRFQAAIYGEGLLNLDGFRYQSNQLLGLSRDMMGLGNPYEAAVIKRAYDQSAIYRLDKVQTPVLIEAGEKSLWEGDRAFYRGLKHYRVPSEFYVYPRSGHGWLEPLLKQDSFRRQIAWFDYWIKDLPYPDAAKQITYDAWKLGFVNPLR